MKNKELVRRMRATTISILTPLYFLKAGSLVDLKKVIAKFLGIFPLGYLFRFTPRINTYTTLIMNTGLTFGTISALIIPTMIANSFFNPIYKHEKALRRFKIKR